MPKDDKKTENALSMAIRRRATKTGTKIAELALMIGLSPSYFTSMLGPRGNWSALNRHHYDVIASFLGIPYINVLMLAGVVVSDDFFMPSDLDSSLEKVYSAMTEDPAWCGLAPTKDEWSAESTKMKILIALMYEKLTEKTLMQKAGMIDSSFDEEEPEADPAP